MTVWPEWKSMDTAPCDGTMVLIHAPHTDPTVSVGWYDGEDMGWLIVENDGMPSMCIPIAWASLPPPPAQTGEGE